MRVCFCLYFLKITAWDKGLSVGNLFEKKSHKAGTKHRGWRKVSTRLHYQVGYWHGRKSKLSSKGTRNKRENHLLICSCLSLFGTLTSLVCTCISAEQAPVGSYRKKSEKQEAGSETRHRLEVKCYQCKERGSLQGPFSGSHVSGRHGQNLSWGLEDMKWGCRCLIQGERLNNDWAIQGIKT